MVLLAIIPAIGTEIYNMVELYGSRVEEGGARTLDCALRAAREQYQISDAARQLLVALSRLDPVRHQNGGACNAIFQGLRSQYPSYEFFGVVDAYGTRFCSSAAPF